MDQQQPKGIQLIEQDEEDKKRKAQGAALSSMGSGAVASGGGSAGTAPSYSATARAQQAAGGPKGSGFTGIGRYLGANVGSRIGQAVSGGISAVGRQARGQLGQAVEKFKGGLSQAQTGLTGAQTGFQQSFGEILAGTSPYIQEQVPGAVGASTDAGGISGATRAYTTPQEKPGISGEPLISAGLKAKIDAFQTGFPAESDDRVREANYNTDRERNFLASLTPEERAEYIEYRRGRPIREPGLPTPIRRPITGPVKEPIITGPVKRPIITGPIKEPPIEQPPAQEPPKTEPTVDGAAAYKRLTGAEELKAPTGLEDLESAQQRASRAAQMAEATRTAGGRAALLQEAFGRGGRLYTKGQTALDALLLGRASKELAGARKEATGVQRQLRSEEKTAQEQSREFQSRREAAAEEAKSAVTGAEQKVSSEIKAQKEQYEKELDRLTTNLTQEIETGELSQESADILENLGIDPTGSQLYNISKSDLAKMIRSRDLTNITEASSADLAQLQKINALRKLAGQEGRFTAEDLARAGQTVGKESAIKGIGTAGELSEALQKGREEYEQILGSIIPGYKGFSEAIPEAKMFRSQADIDAAYRGASEAQKNRPNTLRQIASLENKIKSLERNPQNKKRTEETKKQLEQEKQKLAGYDAAIEKKKRAEAYIQRLQPFEYSPGRGNLARNVDLASRLYSGELFDSQTGELNVDLANQLAGFYQWRPQYLGKEGLFGAGQYGRYAGDESRVQALKKLIEGAGKRFKVKGKELEQKSSLTPPVSPTGVKK